jgi:CDP-diglyceride synthetase
MLTRTRWALILTAAFSAVILAGHAYVMALVLLVQVLSFRELTHIGYAPSALKRLPWTRTTKWCAAHRSTPDDADAASADPGSVGEPGTFSSWSTFSCMARVRCSTWAIWAWPSRSPSRSSSSTSLSPTHCTWPVRALFSGTHTETRPSHGGVSCLPATGIVFFVTTLRKGHYRFQFRQLAWTHMSLFFVVVQPHFIIENVFEGLIW